MSEIALTVNGKRYAGWTSARVTRGIESIAGGFELTVSERWRGDSAPWPITKGAECSLSIDGVTVITGYVDRRSISYSASEHSLSVAGRDKTGDLVDCSVVGPPWEYLRTPILTVVSRLAQPFGIAVSSHGVSFPDAPAKVAADPGDSVFDVIERVCRRAAVLAVSDGSGGLVLMRPGSTHAVTALVEGENIVAGSVEDDASATFARYIVLGQHQATDDWFGDGTAGVRGEATDDGVSRAARVLVIRPEANVTAALATKRAEWEATVRAARADAASVTVQGWQQGNGELWPVNALVSIRSPRLGLDGTMLITQVVFSTGSGGTTTELTLRRPDAFQPEPSVAAPGSGTHAWREIANGV